MTISSSTTKIQYTGDGTTKNWPITFDINGIESSEIEIYLVDLDTDVSTLVESNYTVDLNVPEVVYPISGSAISSSYGVLLARKLVLTQLIDLKNQGPVQAEVIEEGFDRAAMLIQQMQEQIDRTIKADISQEEATLDEITSAAESSASAAAASAVSASASAVTAEAAKVAAQAARDEALAFDGAAIEAELGTNPSGTYDTVVERLDDLPNVLVNIDGNQTLTGIKTLTKTLKTAKGADVASATTTTLGDDGNVFKITGTTTITGITFKSAGTIVILYFEGALTLTDGSNLVLQGDFVTSANSSIILISDGTNWIEVSRSQIASTALALGNPDTKVEETIYQAATDGFIVYWASMSSGGQIACYTDSAASPTTVAAQMTATASFRQGFTVPIKSGNYYQVSVISGSYSPSGYTFIPFS